MIAQIKAEAERQGISLKQLAKMAGFRHPQIYDYVSGKRQPSQARLVAMAEALGCEWRIHNKKEGGAHGTQDQETETQGGAPRNDSRSTDESGDDIVMSQHEASA